jgi:RNA polymerase II subunit A C-terminal domain phosphatase SSU72
VFICETNGGGWVQLELVDTWEDEIDDIIRLFEKQHKRRLIYTICFY